MVLESSRRLKVPSRMIKSGHAQFGFGQEVFMKESLQDQGKRRKLKALEMREGMLRREKLTGRYEGE